jgi:hypothetical protein
LQCRAVPFLMLCLGVAGKLKLQIEIATGFYDR